MPKRGTGMMRGMRGRDYACHAPERSNAYQHGCCTDKGGGKGNNREGGTRGE